MEYIFILGGILILVVISAAGAYIIRVSTDPQLTALKARLRGDHRIECLTPSLVSDATEAAEQRRRFLSGFMEIRHPAEFPRIEIREIPPETEEGVLRREFSPAGAVGQMVRIRWQFPQTELLLLERVVDAAVTIVDRELRAVSAPVGGLLGAVRLEPIETSRKEIFPWVVVLETDYPDIFRPEFERLRSWLGIGIHFDKPSAFTSYGLCKVPGGEIGEAGGILRVNDEQFRVTCAHVLSRNCQSLVCKGDPKEQGQQPDAALIAMQNPCFPSGHLSAIQRTPATRPEIESCHRRQDTVRYANVNHKKVRGYLYGTLSEFPIDGMLYRFPHEEVVPISRLIFGLFPWPPRSARFSEKGDSGSWVITEKALSWVGMLVGGDPFTRISYVTDGASLVDFFKLELIRLRNVKDNDNITSCSLE